MQNINKLQLEMGYFNRKLRTTTQIIEILNQPTYKIVKEWKGITVKVVIYEWENKH